MDRVVADIVVEAHFDHTWEIQRVDRLYYGKQEYYDEREKELNNLVSDFEDFLRDHRSQDMIHLYVEKVYKNVCSNCGDEYEAMYEDGIECCACCGAVREVKDE
jgi:hypothetical protein